MNTSESSIQELHVPPQLDSPFHPSQALYCILNKGLVVTWANKTMDRMFVFSCNTGSGWDVFVYHRVDKGLLVYLADQITRQQQENNRASIKAKAAQEAAQGDGFEWDGQFANSLSAVAEEASQKISRMVDAFQYLKECWITVGRPGKEIEDRPQIPSQWIVSVMGEDWGGEKEKACQKPK